MVFSVVMYGCESWTIKKAEHRRIDAFELWCWRRLLRVPWTARSSKQSILKEISPQYSLKGLMVKWEFQSFGHLMWRTDSVEKTLMLGKTESGRRRGWQRMRWLGGITNSMAMSLIKLQELVRLGVLQSMGSQRIGHSWATELTWTDGSAGEESTCNAGDLGSIPGLERSPGGGKGYPFQCSALENPMDCTVHGVTKSRTRMSDFHSVSHDVILWLANVWLYYLCGHKVTVSCLVMKGHND